MSRFRRDVARNLAQAFKDEALFLQAIRNEMDAGRLKPKAAGKAIVDYYQKQTKLLVDIDNSIHTGEQPWVSTTTSGT